MLDERPLTKGELREFCALLFGKDNFDGVPDPSINWKGFLSDIERLLKSESEQWVRTFMNMNYDITLMNQKLHALFFFYFVHYTL